MARIPEKEAAYVQAALKDANSDLRITGLRIARELKLDTLPYIKMVVKDPSAQVRREAAIALRHSKSPEASGLWAQLALQHDGKDRWYLEALGLAADQQEDLFFDAWMNAVSNNWNTAVGRDIVWRMRAKKVPALLVKLITDKGTSAPDREHYLRALDFIKGPEREAALVELITSGVN